MRSPELDPPELLTMVWVDVFSDNKNKQHIENGGGLSTFPGDYFQGTIVQQSVGVINQSWMQS